METKKKGMFNAAYNDPSHNPATICVTEAVVEYFKTGKPVADYINESTNILDFVIVRTVNGGAKFNDKHVGKVVRFYYSTQSTEALRYEKNNNLVPKSNNSMPIMDLPKAMPLDVDKERYITEAQALLADCEKPCRRGRNQRVMHYTKMGLSIVPWPHKGITISPEGANFSAVAKVGIQTGYRANTIAIKHDNSLTLSMGDWALYRFNDKRYPGAMKAVSKKIGWEIMYGGAIEFTSKPEGEMKPLPKVLEDAIYNTLGLGQRRKVVDGLEFLL